MPEYSAELHQLQGILLSATNMFIGHTISAAKPTTGNFGPTAIDSIAFDAASAVTTASGTSHNLSHTTTGTNRLLVVGIFVANSGDILTSVTYNGVSLTIPAAAKRINYPANECEYLIYLINPATGTNTLTVNFSVAAVCRIHAVSYTGCNQTTQFEQITTNTAATSTSITGSLTTLRDFSWVVMMARNNGANYSAGALTTLRGTAETSNVFDSGGPVTPAGARTLTATSVAADQACVTASIISL